MREERQRELCSEGHRWYDLRRYTVCENTVVQNLSPHVHEIHHNFIPNCSGET
ncbi:MAG: RagB/SusD family nutrient uptake outer membrane protein [Butyricimonas faecihominis]